MAADRAAVHETGVLRLFLAAEVPEDVKQSVEVSIEPWRQSVPDARWIPPENWHITLKFLGAAERGLLPWIEETIGAVASAHEPVEARLTNLGAFPSAGRARVLWAGVDEPGNRLAALVSDLETALARDFRVELRRFHPHLTVARSEPPLRLPDRFATTTVTSGPFTVARIVLFQSHLQRPHSRYERLRRFPIGG